MQRIFVTLPIFKKKWKAVGLTETDFVILQEHLCRTPDSGVVIKGTGGLRKLRWRLPGQGKRGGIRIFYIDYPNHEKLYLITLLSKADKEDLKPEERRKLTQFIKGITEELSNNG